LRTPILDCPEANVYIGHKRLPKIEQYPIKKSSLLERTVEDAGPYRFVACATSSANVTFALSLPLEGKVAAKTADEV